MLMFSQLESGRNPARKFDFPPPRRRACGGRAEPGLRRLPPGRDCRLAAILYPMLCNSASGPEIGLPGRISAGF